MSRNKRRNDSYNRQGKNKIITAQEADTSHIVCEPAAMIREMARSAARGNWSRMFMSFMIINAVLLAGMLIMCLIVVLLPFWRIVPVYGAYYYFNLTAVVAAPLYWLLIAPLALGVCAFMIDTFRGRYASYVRLFSGYKAFFKTLGLMLVIYFRVFAWSLLFIIPGFVAIFRYSMALFVLADHPDWKITACISESKRLMKGNKGKLFKLLISFIGWFVLWLLFLVAVAMIMLLIATLAFDFLMMQGVFTTMVTLMMIAMVLICFISVAPLLSYIFMAVAAFYELAGGRLKAVETERIKPGIKNRG